MSTPNELNEKSKTSPQHAKMLRDIMFLDMVSAKRNAAFPERRKAFLQKKKEMHPGLTKQQLEVMSESFSRRYYGPETKATLEYAALERELKDLQGRPDTQPLSISDKRRKQELEFFVSMPIETYISQKMLNKDTIKSLKAQFPDVDKALKAEIREVADDQFPDVRKCAAHQPATVELFNQKYPGLKDELMAKASSSDPELSMTAKAGLAMLKTGAALANPTGYLVSRGVMGIVMSKPLAPLRKSVSKGISNVAEKTGLKGWLKEKFANTPSVSMRRVAMGVGIASAVTMVALGLSDLDQTKELYAGALDFFTGEEAKPEAVHANPSHEGEMTSLESALSGHGSDDMLVNSPIDPNMQADPLDDLPEVDFSNYQSAMENADAPEASVDAPKADVETPQMGIGVPEAGIDAPADSLNGVGIAAGAEAGATMPQSSPLGPPADLANEAPAQLAAQEAVNPSEPYLCNPNDSLDYTIKPGDTLSEIVAEHLHNSGVPYDYSLLMQHVDGIAAANGIDNPDFIRSGAIIELPDLGNGYEPVPDESIKAAVNESIELPVYEDASPGPKGTAPLVSSEEFWREFSETAELKDDIANPAIYGMINTNNMPAVDVSEGISADPHAGVSYRRA